MKPVVQNLFGDKKGNCFSACLASILEVSIDDIPNFAETTDWIKVVNDWLFLTYGLRFLECDVTDHLLYFAERCKCHYIMSGKSPRGDYWHAVIGKNGKMVHDPHPDNTGLEKFQCIGFLVKG